MVSAVRPEPLEVYLQTVEEHLKSLAPEDRSEIVRELRSHVLDRIKGDFSTATVNATLMRLGDPREIARINLRGASGRDRSRSWHAVDCRVHANAPGDTRRERALGTYSFADGIRIRRLLASDGTRQAVCAGSCWSLGAARFHGRLIALAGQTWSWRCRSRDPGLVDHSHRPCDWCRLCPS